MSERYDAIVVGASFAGLAAARALAGSGRVLVIDRLPVGAGETSACGAPLAVLERFTGRGSIEQVHQRAVIHLPDGSARALPLPYPYATFDYERFCLDLFAATGSEFLRATVRGLAGPGTVTTSAGDLSAPVVIDASGWRAVLAPSARRPRRSLGIELRLPGRDDGLHFWVQHRSIRDGYTWDFPAGDHRRVGILTYGSSGNLRERLEVFLEDRVEGSALHGGALPASLGDPIAGSVFLVGDAAGQCLPLTGEGIRPALVFGHVAGRLAARVLAGRLMPDEARSAYRRIVRGDRRQYAALVALQWMAGRLPRRSLGPLFALLGSGPLSRRAQRPYWAVAPLSLLDG